MSKTARQQPAESSGNVYYKTPDAATPKPEDITPSELTSLLHKDSRATQTQQPLAPASASDTDTTPNKATLPLSGFSCKARVLRVRKDHTVFKVQTLLGEKELVAQRAASCLQVPGFGDIVQLQGFEDGSVYIMAILEVAKETKTSTHLAFPEDSVIDTNTLSIQAKAFNLNAGKTTIKASAFALNAYAYHNVTTQYYLSTNTFTQKADKMDITATNSTSTLNESLRIISDTDRVRANNIKYTARSEVKLEGSNTQINGQRYK